MRPTHDGPMDHLLARLPVAERVRLTQQLDAASLAIWQAHRTLDPAWGAQTSVAQWRAYLHAALEAITTSDELVATAAARP